MEDKRLIAFKRLLDIMDDLREKCPWDRKQSMQSLRYLTIEETYELSDAIMEGNLDEVKKELGDLLLHIVFYAKIGSEKQAFDITDVINGICDKLIARHPHIYGDVKVNSEEEVKANWEKLKLKEGNKSVLSGVPKSLPAMVKAIRLQEKARGIGFDWDNKQQVWEKVQEEIREFKTEEDKGNQEKMEQEFGDILFALINYARFVNINPEDALEKTNKKFISRFQKMEKQINAEQKDMHQMNLEQLDKYWEQAKNNEN
ncbi:MAG TPA: nucleoside triphosphate pyrophosphohydrolase [Flavobacteriales bacterium]|nr:nucleoside triphosphate pyrophosphohydrolase [Flavobacteriales bacterium]|tara:strand:+ start:7320 stop:8093 length:774 start_codon:yes stop_codon:yes gene_type:complete